MLFTRKIIVEEKFLIVGFDTLFTWHSEFQDFDLFCFPMFSSSRDTSMSSVSSLCSGGGALQSSTSDFWSRTCYDLRWYRPSHTTQPVPHQRRSHWLLQTWRSNATLQSSYLLVYGVLLYIKALVWRPLYLVCLVKGWFVFDNKISFIDNKKRIARAWSLIGPSRLLY